MRGHGAALFLNEATLRIRLLAGTLLALSFASVARADNFSLNFVTTTGDQFYGEIYGLASSGDSIPKAISGVITGPNIYGYNVNGGTGIYIDNLFVSPPGTSYGSASGSFTVLNNQITAASFYANTQHTDPDFFSINTANGGSFSLGTSQETYGGAATFHFADTTNPNPQASVSAAPEPSIWALLVAGVGLVGFVLRRRKHWASVSPAAVAQRG